MPMRKPNKGGIQGEGDYVSGRRFQEEERSFVETGPVAAKAREAADALDGPEAAELEEARRVSAKGKSLGKRARKRPAEEGGPQRTEADPHVDRQLDHGLEETFPASDPVSIQPGSD